MKNKSLMLVLLFLMPGMLMAQLPASSQAPQASVTSLTSKDLPEFPGKEVLMIAVEYPPGSVDPIHRHNAHGFIYVLEGAASIMLDDKRHRLDGGSYVYLPAGKDVQIKSGGPATRILIFQKGYVPLSGTTRPTALVGHERDVRGQPFLGNEDARLQVLLPDQPAFDMAINIFTYKPGATLPFVETHIMEHGLMMLAGQGIYRLDADWHPVRAGDVIWMAPYCPQWFVAMGKSPASYIYYKDVNRDPM